MTSLREVKTPGLRIISLLAMYIKLFWTSFGLPDFYNLSYEGQFRMDHSCTNVIKIVYLHWYSCYYFIIIKCYPKLFYSPIFHVSFWSFLSNWWVSWDDILYVSLIFIYKQQIIIKHTLLFYKQFNNNI